MDYLDDQMNQETEAYHPGEGCIRGEGETGPARFAHRGLSLVRSRAKWNDAQAAWRSGEFYKLLPIEAILDFEWKANPSRCAGSSILLMKGERPDPVLLLLEGTVKLSMDSGDGRDVTVGIAVPGDVLGLDAVVSDLPCEIGAVTRLPCQLASLPRTDFLSFLLSYPVVAQHFGLQLSREYTQAREQSHAEEIRLSSGTQLARLLLKWSACGSQTDRGTRIECSLSDEEIGECIGMTRETVSRTLGDLKFRDLVARRGSALIISSVGALEIYANRNDD